MVFLVGLEKLDYFIGIIIFGLFVILFRGFFFKCEVNVISLYYIILNIDSLIWMISYLVNWMLI